MTMRTYFTHTLVCTALMLAGCATTSSDTSGARTVDSEVKRLESQAAEIVANAKKPEASGESRIMPWDVVTIQVWKHDMKTQFSGFPLLQSVPESGKVFIPGIGPTQMSGRTDSDIQTEISNHFSQIVSDPTVRIMPGNDLTVQVWMRDGTAQLSGFPFQQSVPETGKMFIPNVGLTEVGGKTDAELQAVVAGHFSRILVDPTVVVIHKGGAPAEQDSQPLVMVNHGGKASAGTESQLLKMAGHVVMMGWVTRENIYPLEEGMTVRDLIARAGGFGEFANKKSVYVVRGDLKNPEIKIVNIDNSLVGKDLEKNVLLQPNDAVYVPPVFLWKIYDNVRTVLLPVRAIRETIWQSVTPVTQ